MKPFLYIILWISCLVTVSIADCNYKGESIESWISNRISKNAKGITLYGNGDRLQYSFAQPKQANPIHFDIYQVTGLDRIQLDSLWNRQSQCDTLVESLIVTARNLGVQPRPAPEGFTPFSAIQSLSSDCKEALQSFESESTPRMLTIQSYGKPLAWGSIHIRDLLERFKKWDISIGCESDRALILLVAPGLGFLHLLEIPKSSQDKMTIRLHIPWTEESPQEQMIPRMRKPKYTIQRTP